MKLQQLAIKYQEFTSMDEMQNDDKSLALAAIEAIKGAYAPYSNFCVGAAVRLDDGTIVTAQVLPIPTRLWFP